MKNYYTISYKLYQKQADGTLLPFNDSCVLHFANVLADTVDDAVASLKKDFSMLEVEVGSVSQMKTMTDEEFESN